jgi:pantoate kinase
VAESPNTSDTQQDEESMNGARGMGTAVMSATQDAADMARTTAQRAAERLPEAVAGVQVAATETQRRLEELPNEGLLVGTSFSLGLGVGLFMSGANRFLVALALAPAAAMALTIFGRGQTESTGTPIGNRRPTTRSATGTGNS